MPDGPLDAAALVGLLADDARRAAFAAVTLGAATLGIVLFNEPVTAPRLFFLGLLTAAIVGLKLTSGDG